MGLNAATREEAGSEVMNRWFAHSDCQSDVQLLQASLEIDVGRELGVNNFYHEYKMMAKKPSTSK